MIAGRNLLRLGTLLFGAVLVLGAGATANAQGGYDPYYGGDRKQQKQAEKRHRKAEKEALKRRHKAEREELKRRSRGERDGGYYGDDGYYDDGGYSANNRQAVLDSGYREGLRAGRDDRTRNRQYDYERHQTYRNASGGNRGQYGDADAYREGFRRGYDEGYRDDRYRTNSGGGWGAILGEILGRP